VVVPVSYGMVIGMLDRTDLFPDVAVQGCVGSYSVGPGNAWAAAIGLGNLVTSGALNWDKIYSTEHFGKAGNANYAANLHAFVMMFWTTICGGYGAVPGGPNAASAGLNIGVDRVSNACDLSRSWWWYNGVSEGVSSLPPTSIASKLPSFTIYESVAWGCKTMGDYEGPVLSLSSTVGASWIGLTSAWWINPAQPSQRGWTFGLSVGSVGCGLGLGLSYSRQLLPNVSSASRPNDLYATLGEAPWPYGGQLQRKARSNPNW